METMMTKEYADGVTISHVVKAEMIRSFLVESGDRHFRIDYPVNEKCAGVFAVPYDTFGFTEEEITFYRNKCEEITEALAKDPSLEEEEPAIG